MRILLLFLTGLILMSCAQIQPDIDVPDNKPYNSPQIALPCWQTHDPEQCSDIETDPSKYIYFKASIRVDNDKIQTEQTKQLLKSQLMGKYVDMLHLEIKDFIFDSEKCKISGTYQQCDELYRSYTKTFSRGNVLSNNINIIKRFNEPEKNNKIFVHALGTIDRSDFDVRLNTISKYIPMFLSKVNLPVAVDFQPHQINWYRQESCEDVNVQNFKKSDNILKSIKSDIEKMLNSINEEGIYLDSRVKEVISEIRKDGIKINDTTPDLINQYEYETQKYLEYLTRCYEKKISEKNSAALEKELTLLENFNTTMSGKFEYNEVLLKWKSYKEKIEQIEKELNALEKMHNERLKLLSCSYLMFTYAYDPVLRVSIKLIEENEDQIIQKSLKENEIYHYISKWIYLDDTTINTVHKDEVFYNFQQSSSDGIDILPRNPCRGRIQKYKISLKPEFYHGKPDGMALPVDIKANSSVLLGIADIQKMLEVSEPQDYTCKQCGTLINNVYNKLKDIAWEKIVTDIDLLADDEKEKIFRYAEDVIRDNFLVLREYSDMKSNHETKKQKKLNEIEKYQSLIQSLSSIAKEHVCNFLNIPVEEMAKGNNLNDFLNNQYVVQYTKAQDQYINNINDQLALNKKEKTFFALKTINNTEVISFKKIAEQVEKDYYRLIDTICPVTGKDTNVIVNNDLSYSGSQKKQTIPVPESYTIPVFRIRSEQGSNSQRYSILLSLTVNCTTTIEEYRYVQDSHEIIDYDTGFRWEVTNDKIPRKKKDENGIWERVQYSDYLNFCNGYNNYRQTMSTASLCQNWPEMICLRRFEIVTNAADNSKYIVDRSLGEYWKVYDLNGEPMIYDDFIGTLRTSNGWRAQSYDKMKNFIQDMITAAKQGDVHPEIITYISNRKFWTITREGKKYSTIKCEDYHIFESLFNTH